MPDLIYLGASPRTKLFGQQIDIEFDELNMARLLRLAKAMDLGTTLVDNLSRRAIRDKRPDVQAKSVRESGHCARSPSRWARPS